MTHLCQTELVGLEKQTHANQEAKVMKSKELTVDLRDKSVGKIKTTCKALNIKEHISLK